MRVKKNQHFIIEQNCLSYDLKKDKEKKLTFLGCDVNIFPKIESRLKRLRTTELRHMFEEKENKFNYIFIL